jgi:nucleotide-binding universal stress UspA family protein
MIKKILVPLDGSKLAEVVLPFVEELGLKLGAEVFMISVTNNIQGYWPFEDASQPDKVTLVPQGVCTTGRLRSDVSEFRRQTAGEQGY